MSLTESLPSVVLNLSAVMCCVATDILLGYHSEEGWTAAIHLLTGHYGLEVEVSLAESTAHTFS
jgi:hypothetical protein